MTIQNLIRPTIKALKPYSSARDEFQGVSADMVFLDANENPFQYFALEDLTAEMKEGFDLQNIKSLIEKLERVDGKIAQYALTNHWVDSLKTREKVNQEMISLVGKNKHNSFNQISFKEYLIPASCNRNNDRSGTVIKATSVL